MGHHKVDPSIIFEERRHFADAPRRMVMPVTILGLLMLGVSVLLALISDEGFAMFGRHYLVAYTWWTSIIVGAMFFVIIQHLTKAGWSVVVRRVPEILGCAVPTLA
ncbi:MAG TPA: hypothetical protein PKE00_12730, partial [Planctomycetota bacterium]|nr:hypothetical protein [Planctomycetota bacterium]